VYQYGTVACSADNWVETAAVDGTYDETTYPLTLDNIGTIEQTWTLTFSSATEFEVVGDVVGSIGTGDTSTDFIPINEDWTKPYFTLDAYGWADTWQANDTVVFQTHPAAVPFWLAQHVPVSCAPLPAGAKNTTKWAGEYV
jgi:hypothetical protein